MEFYFNCLNLNYRVSLFNNVVTVTGQAVGGMKLVRSTVSLKYVQISLPFSVTHVNLNHYMELSQQDMTKIITREQIHLGSEYGVNRGETVQVRKGINHYVIIPIGKIEHKHADKRPYCEGEEYRDSRQQIHPSAVVTTSYKITYR